jgi:hypothetical protein
MTTYSDLDVYNNWVTIRDDMGEHEVIVRRDCIESFAVDWLTANGSLALHTNSGVCHTVTFDRGDGGQACADAISDLMKGSW